MSITLPWRIPRFGPEIETSITTHEAAELEFLARDHRVLEIGAAFGYSTVLMALVAEHVTSVDHHLAHQSEEKHNSNLHHYGVAHKVIRIVAPSRQALPLLDPMTFDFIFVDGDHTFAGVVFDLEQSLRLIRPEGVIAFHDWNETTCPDVKRVLEAWLAPPDRIVDTLAIYRI